MSRIHPSFRLCGHSHDTQIKTDDSPLGRYTREAWDFVRMWNDDSPHIECHSSGSTGTPKKILLPKDVMARSAEITGEFFQLAENSRALLCLPMQYIAARMMLVRAMTLGWQIDIAVPSADVLCQVREKYDFTAVVPMQMYSGVDFLHLHRNILVGGGDVNHDFINQLSEKKIATRIYQSYGMTETASHVALRMLYPTLSPQYEAVSGVSFSTDQDDCLQIHAPHLHPEVLSTTDVVRLGDKKHFSWIGRRDFVINSGGIKIHPEETEKTISTAMTHHRYFVTGVPDARLGQRQILMIEGRKEEFPHLEDFLAKHLDSIHRPKDCYFCDSFIYTDSGKIDRRKTVEIFFPSKR